MLEAKTASEEAKRAVETAKFLAFKASVCSDNSAGWCVDFIASNHMTKDANFFSSMRTAMNFVNIADGSRVEAKGVGKGHLICAVLGGKEKIVLQTFYTSIN